MTIIAVIFDLDGVICHTDQYHYRAWKKITSELNIEFDEQINNRLRGVSRMSSFEIILEAYPGEMSDERKAVYVDRKNNFYLELLSGMSPKDVSADVSNTLAQIRRGGIKMAIGSSSANAKYILERIGYKDYFDAISDGTNISRSKPDPQVFLKAAGFLGIPPNDCIVVEDAKAGIEAALAAGMDCAAISDAVNGGRATYNLTRLSDLLQWVL